MTIAFIVYAVFWFVTCIRNRKEFLTLQFYITIVLMSCLAEAIIVYFDYFLTNKIGERNSIVQIGAMILTVIRKTWTRLIILIICSGFLGSDNSNDEESSEGQKAAGRATRHVTSNVLILYSVIYVLLCGLSEFGEFLFYREMISHSYFITLSLPVGILDCFYFVWTLYLLYNTMSQYKLSDTRSVPARERASPQWKQAIANHHYFYLYRRLMLAMLLYAWSVLFFMIAQFIYEYKGYYKTAWYLNWLFDSATYQVAFFSVFVLIGFLYRPAKHNSMYLHSEQLPTDELEAEYMLKESTGLEYQSDDSDDQDVEMMMMENNEPIDASGEDKSPSENKSKNEEQLVFIQESQENSPETNNQ